MVNAGRAHGVSADSSLLVKRGNARVGRLRIVSLEDMMTVADVVDEAGVSGVVVKPGDKVIFESTN
jgi:transcription elongation GreA/GreB family factor